MKNKKGFTLVELLAVIAIMAILMTIAIPSYLAISGKIKEKMRESKIATIESAAELWAQDHKNSCEDITIEDLLNDEDYLKADGKDNNGKYIIDPKTGEKITGNLNNIGINMSDICNNVKGNQINIIDTNAAKWGGKNHIPDIVIENANNYAPFYITYDGKVPEYERKTNELYMEDGSQSPLPQYVKFPNGEVLEVAKWELSDDIHFRIEENIIYANLWDYGTSTLTAISADGKKQTIKITNYHPNIYFQDRCGYSQSEHALFMGATSENMVYPFSYYISVFNETQNKDITSLIKDNSYNEIDPDLEIYLVFPADTNINDTFKICIYAEIDYYDCKTVTLKNVLRD